MFIFEKYFQKILIDFIVNLFKYVKNERIYEYIIIIINKLFKKKVYFFKFVESKDCDTNLFEINITRKRIFRYNCF